MRSKGKLVGRVDSRYVGGNVDPMAESSGYDPYSAAIAPAIVATFNDYYRKELKVAVGSRVLLSGGVSGRMGRPPRQPDAGGLQVPVANTAIDLAQAMAMNPKMQVLIQQGYFDLACPYGTVQYFVNHLDVPAEVRRNVSFEYYDAGHMMYVHPASMVKFKKDLAAFIEATSR